MRHIHMSPSDAAAAGVAQHHLCNHFNSLLFHILLQYPQENPSIHRERKGLRPCQEGLPAGDIRYGCHEAGRGRPYPGIRQHSRKRPHSSGWPQGRRLPGRGLTLSLPCYPPKAVPAVIRLDGKTDGEGKAIAALPSPPPKMLLPRCQNFRRILPACPKARQWTRRSWASWTNRGGGYKDYKHGGRDIP